MAVLFKSIPPVTEWPLVWEPMVLGPLRGPGRTVDIEVPFRRCPHGGYYQDDKATPPRILNSWGLHAMPSCPEGRDGPCRAAYRTYLHGTP